MFNKLRRKMIEAWKVDSRGAHVDTNNIHLGSEEAPLDIGDLGVDP